MYNDDMQPSPTPQKQSFRLVELTQRASRPTPVMIAILLTPLFLLGGALFGQGLIASLFLIPISDGLETASSAVLSSSFTLAALLSSSYLGVLLILWIWVKWYEKRPLWTLGLEKNRALHRYVTGLLTGLMMMSIWVAGLWLVKALENETGNIQLPDRGNLAAGGMMLIAWMIQGGVEEILSRGWLLGVISTQYRVWLGVAISSLIFGLLHGLNPGVTWLALVNLCLYGVMMAFWVLKEGSLWGVCGIHSAWNWAQANIFGLDVSGIQAGGGIVIDLSQIGPDWLTGGAFGPEGGLGVTCLLLVGIVVLFARLWGKSPGSAPQG